VPSVPYLVFLAALTHWGTSSDAATQRKVQWRKDVAGDAQKKKQLQEVTGTLQDFKMYCFVKPGSAFVMVIHSLMKFVAISKS
jgi:hypothetical protein